MSLKVLVSTCSGRDVGKVNAARRALPYDQLVLICGDRDSEEVRRLVESERIAHPPPEVVPVDPFDLPACLAATIDVIRRHQKDDGAGPAQQPAAVVQVRVNVSGGPKPLSMGALLACLVTGTEAYHCEPGEDRGCVGACCEDQVVRLPSIRGIVIRELFSPAARRVAERLTAPATVDELARASRIPAPDVHRALAELWNQRLVEVTGDAPPHRYRWTPHGRVIRGEILRRKPARHRRA